MKFNASQISDIIQMAWDDQTDFSHITKIYDIDEGEVFQTKLEYQKFVKEINDKGIYNAIIDK